MAGDPGKNRFGKPKRRKPKPDPRHRAHSKEMRERPKHKGPPPTGGNAASTGGGGGRGGGGYGGGGGGGGAAADPSKPYIAYYKRYLNIGANMTLVKLAAKEKMTMQDFALLVQRKDTERFLKTWKGQEVADNWREMFYRIFPSLGKQPGIKSLRTWLKQEPAKGAQGYRKVTNPTSMLSMYKWVQGTKLFKQTYPEFDKSLYAQTLDFAGYQRERTSFKQILSSYTGRPASQDETSFFFKSRISSGDFEKNLQTMLAGREAYNFTTGANVGAKEEKNALYGREGSAATLAKVAAAYRQQGQFQASKPTEYMTTFDQETGRVKTPQAY